MRISRKDKKKLKVILLLHTGNYLVRKEKISKKTWVKLKTKYHVWLFYFLRHERSSANEIKRFKNNE